VCVLISHIITVTVTKKQNKNKQTAAQHSSSVTTVTILMAITRRVHYDISLTQQQMRHDSA
jgi:hypothetical protein